MAGIPAGEAAAVVWCEACGVPHEGGAVVCAGCGRWLTDDETARALAPVAPATAPAVPRTFAERLGGAPGKAGSRQRERGAAGRWPGARRPPALSDDEVEARAAAIVAQAQAEEARAEPPSPPIEPRSPEMPRPVAATGPAISGDDPLAYLDLLPPLRERDRLWLIAGLVGCAILIVGVVVFVRYMGG